MFHVACGCLACYGSVSRSHFVQAVFRGLVKQIQKQAGEVPADVHAEFARLDPEVGAIIGIK